MTLASLNHSTLELFHLVMEKTHDDPGIALAQLKTLAGRWSLGLTQETAEVRELVAYLTHLAD
jgi:hypothetical protein